jgi:HEAT repeat protein
LESSAAFDEPQSLALMAALAAAVLTAAMLAHMLVLRSRNRRRRLLRERVTQRWRPLLLTAAVESLPVLPPLKREEAWAFALLWQHIAEGVRGDARERLREVLRHVGMVAVAREWLERPEPERRVVALAMLGHYGDPMDWEAVLGHIDDRRPELSLMAARALALADPRRAVPVIVAQLLKRHDWPASRVAALLREAGTQFACKPLLGLIQLAGEADLPRLLPLLGVIDEQEASHAVGDLLQRVAQPQVLVSALAEVSTPAALPAVRALTDHPSWNVRAEAASALMRVGTTVDRPTLIRLMADREWWVRYHAARAVVSLPGTTPAVVEEVRLQLSDRYARDMLEQVIAEGGLQ